MNTLAYTNFGFERNCDVVFRFPAAALAAVSVFLVAGSALTVTPARAEPADTHVSAAAGTSHRVTISATEYKALSTVVKVKSRTRTKTLDYRVAAATFGKDSRSVNWRRQFAAGWKVGGGKITHVSAAELRQIEAARKKGQARSMASLSVRDGGMTTLACSGRTAYVRLPRTTDYMNLYYYNSCDTNVIIRNLGWCVGIAGAITALAGNPGVTAIMAIVGFGCGGSAAWVSTAQANSDIHAVLIKTGDIIKYNPNPSPSNPVRYQVPVQILPQ